MSRLLDLVARGFEFVVIAGADRYVAREANLLMTLGELALTSERALPLL